MSLIANLGINLDTRDAAARLRQFVQGTQAAGRAAEQLQGSTASLASSFAKQQGSTATLAAKLRALKGEYANLAAAAKASAKAGGEGFSESTIARLRTLSAQIKSTRESFIASKTAASQLRGEMDALGSSAEGASSRFKDLAGQAATKASSAFRQLGGIVASIGVTALTANMVRNAASAEQLQLRLKLLSREYGETDKLQAFVSQSAKQFGQSQVEAAQSVTDVYARLRPIGISLEQIQTTYKGFNAVALASGASAEAASGAFLQLSQALGSGRLQGDEFRSIAEQVPGILQLVSKEMGVTVGQLKQLGSDGKITSEILIKALAKGFEENKDKIQELLELSPAQKFKEFQNASSELSNAIGSELLPAITPLVQFATELIKKFGELPAPARTASAAVFGLSAAFIALAPGLRAAIPLIGAAAQALGIQGLAGSATVAKGAIAGLLPLLGKIAAIGVITIGLKFAIEGADEFLTGQMGAAQADRLARDMAERRGLTYTPSKAVQRRFAAASAYKSPFAGARDEAFRRAQLITGEPAAAVTRPSAVSTAGTGTKGAAAKEGPKDTSAELQEQIKRFREQADIQNRIRDLQFQGRERLAAETQLEAEILQINYDRNDALKAANFEGERRQINALAESKIIAAQAESEDRIREIKNRRFQEELQNQQAVRDAAKVVSDVREQQELQFKNAEEYRKLLQDGLLPAEAQRILNFQSLVKEQLKALDAQIDITKAAYLEAESRGLARSELAKEIELLESKRKAIQDAAAAGPGRGETDIDRINAGATAAQEKLNELTNLGNIVVTSANNIGNAFGEAFNKLVTGAGSAKQVLSEFFQSVAQGFFKMAQEIIAQTLIMITLQAILKALGGASASGSADTPNLSDVQSGADFNLGERITTSTRAAAKGDAFTPQGPLERYAKGGIVNAPTLFRYAKGGTFAPGLMGEAGPEAILPLRRTPDGRLGVTQVRSPQDADRMREMMGRSPAQQQAPMLNLKFETTTINGVEYVSREQLEVAMAETRKRASKEGAERGMSMTLDKMRNSPRTRAQVGMR